MSHSRYEAGNCQINHINAKLLYISTSKFGNDWNSKMHTHFYAELFYITHGKGTFTVENDSFNVMEDDLVIVNPNVEHTEKSLNESPLEYIVLGIEGLDFLFHRNSYNNYRVFNYRAYRQEFMFYFKALLKEIEKKSLQYEVVCYNLLEVLIINMQRHTDFSISVTASKQHNKECARIKRYIDANYTEDIALDSLAEMAHLNKYYLIHAFKCENGLSPINYLIKRRIIESKYFLSNTNHSISQIACILGFSSPSYFSQSFKKLEGQSPNKYRKEKKTL